MKTSLKNYTFRYLVPMLLVVIGLWAFLFYHTIVDEVYDNIDDGLKNQKIEIIREAFINPEMLKTTAFGINQFRIAEVTPTAYSPLNRLTTEMVFMPYDGEYEPYRILHTGFTGPDRKYYTLQIRTSMMEEDEMIFNLSVSLIVLYVLILISTMVIHQIVIRKALKPFYRILEQIRKYRLDGNRELTRISSDVKEFSTLEEEVLTMIDRNEEMYANQKLFIENASHELQTPLAVTISRLELILENEEIPEQEYLGITEVKDALWRMVRLNKALLMLSRISNKQYRNTAMVDFTAVLQRLLEDIEPIVESEEVKVDFRVNGSFIAGFNPEMAEVLLSNLLRNAIRHNDDRKAVEVYSDADKVEIRNTGQEFPLNPNLIYERFYKQGMHVHNSNGLGLSIVRSILEGQNVIGMKYQFEEGLHQFTLYKK